MIIVGHPIAPARLRGSDRQVAWALRVRAAFLPEIHEIRDGAAARLRTAQLTDLERDGYAAMVEAADALLAEERAGWWIDMRGHSAHSLVAERVERARRAVAREER